MALMLIVLNDSQVSVEALQWMMRDDIKGDGLKFYLLDIYDSGNPSLFW